MKVTYIEKLSQSPRTMRAVLSVSLAACTLFYPAFAQNTKPTGEPTMEIDVRNAGEVISPLLFGHNLEVTRRCIYGGLSAEMVSNRKFAALDNGIPRHWSAISSSTQLVMDSEVTYAGRASLRVDSDGTGGLRQQIDAPLFPKGSWKNSFMIEDYSSDVGGILAFHKGKKYTFRWQIKTDTSAKNVWMRITDISGTKTIAKVSTVLKPGTWQTWSGSFQASETVDNARLEIGSTTSGSFWVGAGSVQPSDAFHGMRRDVIALLKELKPGALRFPGGCYSDYPKWSDGLLPVDERPVIDGRDLHFLLPDTDGYDTQELNIDDFVALCRELKCQPAITARMCGTDDVQDAVGYVEYCNGSKDTKWGKVRAEHGHPEPYNVKVWFVGNELYFTGRNGLKDPVNAASGSQAVAQAMKKVDPTIELVGCTSFLGDGTDEWNTKLMQTAGKYLAYGSYHRYSGEIVGDLNVGSMARICTAVGSACQTLSKNIDRKVVLDEWNMFWGRKATMPMALHVATMLNMLCRDSSELGISQAFYFQPINEGAIIVSPLEAKLDLAGKVFALYAVHQGSSLIKIPGPPSGSDIDVCASLSKDGKKVFVTAVNRNSEKELPLSLALDNFGTNLKADTKMLLPRSLENTETQFAERNEALTVKDGRLEANLPPCAIARFVVSAK